MGDAALKSSSKSFSLFPEHDCFFCSGNLKSERVGHICRCQGSFSDGFFTICNNSTFQSSSDVYFPSGRYKASHTAIKATAYM